MNEDTTALCSLKLGLVACLPNIPATCLFFSGMGLLRQVYVLPHWDRSRRSNFLPHPVTVYWHWVNQSQHWSCNTRRLAGLTLECQCLSHWYDLTTNNPGTNGILNPGSSATEVDALTIRPTRRSQGQIPSDNCTCCHTETEVADQTCNLIQLQYTNTGPASPRADPATPGVW